ncbi:NAD(P)-dependent oxidoreductase [Variovorax sp. PCZ-1]|uniref:NAD(P)-dependent oxidoreductase n=1 Tax=Variovorax sp. PCZ-1 TaxID=2835533 RepID=UPI001BD0ADC1|nr:NAD(P)-dependent oxidoreductase [Variovorax sp. PCZ-1]MBS7807866.1 NAD(P)-dependent oxidoreductase [Variovorax sp. PCZ-1]
MKNIGLIGAGLMGQGIASNLLKKGYSLTVLEHAGNQPLDALLGLGAKTAATPALLAQSAELIILCVTGSPQVEDVLLSSAGVLAAIQPGTVVIDCSTAVPTSTERVAKAVTQAGGLFMDAPMTRTAKEAAEGRLNLLVGADAALLERCMPVLRCFAENITHAGPVGSGHRMKLLHNYVSLGTAALIAEAAACAQVSGVAMETFVEVLSKGGGAGVALERMKPYLLSGDASGLRFTVSNALKDINYYNTMAQDAGADSSIAAGVKNTLAAACTGEDAQAFVPELMRIIAQRTGHA